MFFKADYFAAWPVIKKLAVLINLNNLQAPDEENYANFKSMIKPFPPQLVRKSYSDFVQQFFEFRSTELKLRIVKETCCSTP